MLIPEESKEKQPLQVKQQEILVPSVELVAPVALSFPRVKSKTVPDVVDEGFVMVSHSQTPVTVDPVDSLFTQEKPLNIEAESVSIRKGQEDLLGEETDVTIVSPVVSQHEPASEDTLASDGSPIADEEAPLQSYTAVEFELKEEAVVLDVGSQTGNSLLLDQPKKETVEFSAKDVGIICHPPVDTEVQTEFSSQSVSEVVLPLAAKEEVPADVAVQTARHTWASPAIEMQKNKIHVFKKTMGDEETIEIATKAGVEGGGSLVAAAEPEKYGDTGDELLVEVKYKGKGQEDNQAVTSMSELNIVHTAPQSFETLLIDPGESTTEVIVDKDGNQKIIVRKVRQAVVSQQQQQHTVQQRCQTFTTSDIGSEGTEGPVTQSVAFSQVTLQGQKSTVSESQGDGTLHVTTTKLYTGKIAAGCPGGGLTFSEFSTEPQHQTFTYHTVSGETEHLPASSFLSGIGSQEISDDGYMVVEPSEADITSTEVEPEHSVTSKPEEQGTTGDQLVTTSTSSVHTVVQQVTRRVRRVRRVVRKVVVIDGKEHVTEEVVEEPEEVEVTEEEIPRVTVHISRTGDVDIGQQILDHDLQTGYQLYSPGDKPIQVDPGFVPGISHKLPLRENVDNCGSVILDFEGRPVTDSQGIQMVEKHEPSQLQDEITKGSMDVQTPMEKQEQMQEELKFTAPGSLHEEEVTAENTEVVSMLFVHTPEEVVVPGIQDAKAVPVINNGLKDQVDRQLPDKSKSPLLQDTQMVEEDKIVPETSVEHTRPQELIEHLAASEYHEDNAVIIGGEELPVQEEIFGDVTSNISEQNELKVMTDIEEIVSNIPSVFDSVSMKLVEAKPKTESQSKLSKLTSVADSDIQHVEDQSSETLFEKAESSPVVCHEASVAGIETVTQIPDEASSDISTAMKRCILPELKETHPTQESDSQKVVTELQDQCVPVQFPGTQKDFDVQTQDITMGENLVELSAKSSEFPEGKGTVDKIPSEDAVESQSAYKLHTTIEDTAVTASQPELSRVTDMKTTEQSEGGDFTPSVVIKSVPQHPKPNEFQETTTKPDGRVCQDMTSQTTPEQGVKTIEFVLSVEEKAKPSLQETSDVVPKVSATVKIEERGLGALSEDKRDKPPSVTLPHHEIVKEDFAVQLPGTKTVSYTATEEIITSARLLPTSVKTETEPREETSSKSEADNSTSKKSRKRKKHKIKELGKNSLEVDAEEVETPEETPEIIIHDVTLDTHEGQVSVETSIAESTEITIPGSPASTLSDTTKPTEQETEMFETHISPHSPRDSEGTHDTGYDPEDKTTLDETSILEEDDKQRKKKKKKKKQKVVKESKESSTVIPESSIELVAVQTEGSSDLSSMEQHDVELSKEVEREVHAAEPCEVSAATSDSTAEEVTTDGVPIERKGRKRKKDKSEPENAFELRESDVALNMQIADTHSPEFYGESQEELKPQGIDSVKIMEEGVPTRPPSEALDALGDSYSKPVEVWELLHVQEQSAQTVTPDISKSPDAVMVESSMQTIKEEVPVTQDDSVQAVTPEVPVPAKTEMTDFSVQTWKEEVVSTQEESAQTKTPEVVDREAVLTTETSVQTLEMKSFPTQEEYAQTLTPEPTELLVAVDTVDSSIQTKAEEITPVQEVSMQTLTPEVPVADTKDTSIQTLQEELSLVHEESVQTLTSELAEIPEPLKLERNEMSIQTCEKEINPVCEESVQTVTLRKPFETAEMPSQTVNEDSLQTQDCKTQTNFSPEVSEITQVAVFETSIQTSKEDIIPAMDEYSQTVLPEKTEITETSAETTKASVPSVQEEYAQTSSDEVPYVTETFIQSAKEELMPAEEQYSQMADTSSQSRDNKVIPVSEEFLQMLPPGWSEPEDVTIPRDLLEPERTEMIDTAHRGEDDAVSLQDLPETTLSHVLFIPVDTKVETAETSIQTKPVLVKEYGDERSHSSSSEEPYEIHIQTSVSFTPSLESGDIWRTKYDTNTGGASEDKKPRTPGDSFVSTVCEIGKHANICTTTEIPVLFDAEDVESAQVTKNVFNKPGVEVEPITDIKPDISTDLPSVEPKEDVKKVMYDFLSSEIDTELKDRESRQQVVKLVQEKTVPDSDLESAVERETAVTTLRFAEPEKEKQPSKNKKSKHKKKPKKLKVSESSVREPVWSGYREQTSSESVSETTDFGEAQLITEVSCEEDVPELKPESVKASIMLEKDTVWTEDKVVIPSEPEITSEEKPQHLEVSVGKKSKKSSKVLGSPADTELVTGAELSFEMHMCVEEIPPELKPSYSAVSKLPPTPEDHTEAVFLMEEREVSGQPVRGEHSPGPPVEHETMMATEYSPDLSCDKDMKQATSKVHAAIITEQFLRDSREHPVDTTVDSDLTYVKEELMADTDITEKIQDKSVTITSQNVTPVITSEESELVLQEPILETQVPHIIYSEREVGLSNKHKSPVVAEDISVQLEVSQPSDVISRSVEDSDITEKIQAEPITITGQDVTPVTISEESVLVLQEPSVQIQEPYINYSEHEMELIGCKGPVTAEDTSVQFELSKPSGIISESVADSGITERIQDKPVTGTSQDVTPVIISEKSELVLQEPSTEIQEPHISYSEHELELSECKSPVFSEDSSIHFEPSQPADVISIPVEESVTIKWKKANNILSERVKNLQNARKMTHMSGVLYLATLQEVVTEEPVEQKSVEVQHNLSLLRSAVEKKDIVVIQKTIITTVETISTWLETVEYRVYLSRQKTNTAPTQEQIKEYGTLKAEIINIEESVDALEGVLETASGICSEGEKIHMRECLASLQEHVKSVEEIAQESEEKVAKDLICWEEFLNGVNNISVMVEQLKQQLEELVQSDISAQSKLQELEAIETVNCCHKLKTSCLLKTARNLVRDFPGREIPPETYTAHETTRVIEHSIALERERLLQLLSLADDYEQTLKEFSQIVDVADTLVDSPISVISLEHLQEEMQKHRKFFVNLSHCRGILESLEGNLDPETRASHSQLHQTLHCRATAILDKAASRAQQMALAASRWTVLEQGMKEERGWLQVAHQRVPDLQTVNSSDYDQYISLYQVSTMKIVKQIIKWCGLHYHFPQAFIHRCPQFPDQ